MEVQFDGFGVLLSSPWPPPPEKDEMKRFGGTWDPPEKVWRVPLSSPIIRWLELIRPPPTLMET